MRIQLLKLSLIKSKLLFKLITCGLIDSETFLKDNLSSDDEDNPQKYKKNEKEKEKKKKKFKVVTKKNENEEGCRACSTGCNVY